MNTPQNIFRLKASVIAIATCFAPMIQANPVGPTVINGTANIANNGNTLTVTNTPGAILHWQQFNIDKGQTTQFNQQSAQSAVLNRVIGPDASQILGTLRSNGQVFLINPNGIMFGAGSLIDVNGLIASTLNITNADFLANNLKFNGNNGTSVLNQGQITTPFGGSVYLIGNDVTNQGIITTPQGHVVLAAGSSVSMAHTLTPHISVTVNAPEGGQAVNLGQINAQGGSIDMYGAFVKQQGVVGADSATVDAQQGRVVLSASQAVEVSAGSTTSVTNSAGMGGSVQILGPQVNVAGAVDASGSTGGGSILVGGDYQGKNPEVANAIATVLAPGAILKADATGQGDGGKVIVWANDTTSAHGVISAKGGVEGGNGGLVETSAHQLDVDGIMVNAQARSPMGAAGTWLLDPIDVTITAGGADGVLTGSTITNATIESALNAGTSVSITTTGTGTSSELGDINVNAPITKTVVTTSGYSTSLRLDAANSVNVNAAVGQSPNANFDLVLIAPTLNINDNIQATQIYLQADNPIAVAAGKTVIASDGNTANPSGNMFFQNYSSLLVVGTGGLVDGASLSNLNGTGVFRASNIGFDATNSLTIDSALTLDSVRLSAPTVAITNIGSLSGSNFNITAANGLTNAGTLTGTGTVTVGTGAAGFINQGTINPGGTGATGTITVTGDMQLTTGSVLNMEVGGAGQSDKLIINGNLTNTAGTINANVLSEYTPTVADAIPFLTASGTSSGIFTTSNLPTDFNVGYNLATGEAARLIYGSGAVTFTNASGGLDWAAPGNWSTNSLPGSTDTALISTLFSVAHNSGKDSIGTLMISQGAALDVSGGELEVTVETDLHGLLTVSGTGIATLNGINSSLSSNLSGIVSVSGGNLNLGGISNINNLTLTSGTITLNSGALATDVFSQSGGTWNQAASASLPGSLTNAFGANDFRITGGTFIRAMSGDGSVGAPYQLVDIYGLQGMGSAGMLDKSYVLASNIDASGTTTWNSVVGLVGNQPGFVPIGNTVAPFTGTLNGSGHTISNLNVNRPNTDDVGLFGQTQGATLSQIGLQGGSVTGQQRVGSLVGSNGGTIDSSYAQGGGVTGSGSVGGLVGYNTSSISNTYTVAGTVSGSSDVGGLVGNNTASVSNSYAGNIVAGSSSIGGLIGTATAGDVTNSYWDTSLSGQTASAGGTGMSDTQMRKMSSFTDWNIANTGGSGAVWRIFEGNTAPLLISFLAPLTLADATDVVATYNGAVQSGLETATPITATLLGSPATGTNAGFYNGYYSNQQGYDITGGNLTITPKTVALSANKTYDGSADLTGKVTIETGISGEALNYSIATANDKNVATDNKYINAITLTDGSGLAGNYQLPTLDNANAPVTITAAPLSVTAPTVTKTYDGNTSATGAAPLGTLAGAGDTINTPATLLYTDPNAGNANKTVQASGLTLKDSDNADVTGNYAITYTDNTASTITPKTVALSASKTYDGTTDLTGAVTITTGISGEALTYTDATASDKNVLTPNKYINAITLTDGTGQTSNYQLPALNNANAPVTITPAALTVTAPTVSKTYDGTTSATGTATVDTLTVQAAGDVINTPPSLAYTDKNAGIATVQASGLTIMDSSNADMTSNYAITYTDNTTSTIAQAPLTISTGNVTKTYDGGVATDGLPETISGQVFTGDALSGGTVAFTDKNVGINKTVTVSGVMVGDGKNNDNYKISYVSNTASAIAVRPLSNWIATGDGQWSDAANWDALPDAANVSEVKIPTGVTVTFDAAADTTTRLQSINSAGGIALTGGNLSVAGNLTTAQYSQTAGDVNVAGAIKVNNGFSQTAGTIAAAGPVTITQSVGNLKVGAISSPSISLEASAGSLGQSGALQTSGLLSVKSVGEVVLNHADNKVGSFQATTTGAGNVELTNVGVLDSQNIKVANGDIKLTNTGGISTSGPVVADNGNVSMTANSPLTIGASGVLARGNITLTATNLTSAGNMTLDGPVVSNEGAVYLTAASNFIQNGLVSAPRGVTATAGGKMTFGPGAITVGNPVSYTAAGIAIKPPPSSLTPGNIETCMTNQILCGDKPADSDSSQTILPNDRPVELANNGITYTSSVPSVMPIAGISNDVLQARNEARKADDEADDAENAIKYAGTSKHKQEASEYALVKSSEADIKRADAKIREAEAEIHLAEAEMKSATLPQEKMRAELRRAVAEFKRAEGETDKADAQTRLAEAEVRAAKTPEAKAEAQGKLAAVQAKKADAEAKKAAVDVKKAETEVKQAEAEAKASGTQNARQAVESKKADLQAKKAEAEVKKAEAEVKLAKTPTDKAKAEEKMAAAEVKKAESEAKKSELQARQAEDNAKSSGLAVDKQVALAQKADAEVKKADVEVKLAQIEAKTANTPKALKSAEEKLAKAQARKAELEHDQVEQEVKVAEAIAAKSAQPQAKKEVEAKKADAEVKKADAQVKKAEVDIKTANTPKEKEIAKSRHLDAESKKIDAELRKAEIEASQDKAAANFPQSAYLKNSVDKKAIASAARVEALKAERDAIRAKSDVTQAELAVKDAKTPEARTAAEKQLEARRSQTLVKEQKLASLKTDANAKDAESKVAKRSSDNKVSGMFDGMALASMSAQRVKDAMVARHEFMQDTLKTAINLLKANPQAANIRPCSMDGGDTCIRPVNPALTAQVPRNRVHITTPTLSYVPAIHRKVAVVIGNNAYNDPKIPSLDGAIKDADAIGALLKEKMGYSVYVMHNGTKADIIRKLNQVSDETGSEDSVMVYYAGHGYQMEDTRMGYWIPSDASARSPVNWISNSDISNILATIPAKQMILMSDSCYSGTLTSEQRISVGMTGDDIQNILSKRSVLVMSSGGEEPVLDEGREGHSIFAWHLIDRLNNVTQYKSGFDVFGAVKSAVAHEGIPQTPQYGTSISAGHKAGGEYLFEVRKY